MTDGAKRLSLAARALSPEDRLELVEQLLDSLDAPSHSAEAEWLREADERLAAYRRGEIEAVGLSDVLARYRPS